MDYIVDHVQFARLENEPRLREILNVSTYIKTGSDTHCYIHLNNQEVQKLLLHRHCMIFCKSVISPADLGN